MTSSFLIALISCFKGSTISSIRMRIAFCTLSSSLPRVFTCAA
nr:MAG TPA: hypothetical protein [Caudoviricetes sp.]